MAHILFLFFSAIFFLALPLSAQEIPSRPQDYVNDYAGILSRGQVAQLSQMLRAYEDSTSNQIVVAIFPDAQGYPVEEFSIRLAEMWKVGQKGRDNGVILAVFLKERKVRIEVGYGLEDVIPDARAFEIIREFIIPHFRENNYFEGIRQGCLALMASASGKYEALTRRKHSSNRGLSPAAVFLFFVIVLILLLSSRRRGGTFTSRGYRGAGPIFWGGFGGRGFGGGGGGGFSGGGGSFGGGGATGSW